MAGPIDNFNDNARNTGLWDELIVGTLATVAEINQHVEVTPPSSAAGSQYKGYRAVSTDTLTNANAFIEIVQVTSSTTAETGFDMQLDASNKIGLYKTGTLLKCFKSVGGSYSESAAFTYSPTTHRWWRLRHVSSDDTIRWDTSDDGSNWTERASEARPFAVTAVRSQFYSGTWESVASPGVGIFDNANTLDIAEDQPAARIVDIRGGAFLQVYGIGR